MSPRYQGNSPLVCHCLRVTEDDVLDASQQCPLKTVRDVTRTTGAGAGCTSCHRHIAELIRRQNGL